MKTEPVFVRNTNNAEVGRNLNVYPQYLRRENALEMPATTRKQSRDGSYKYVFTLPDGLHYEASAFRISGRERPNIACVSTQLGCAVGCRFCAAGNGSFYRNLAPHEILHQVQTILEDMDIDLVMEEGFEVSFMGMGEPLANLPNLLEVIREIGYRYPPISRVS